MDRIHTGKESLNICKILIHGLRSNKVENEDEIIIKALNKLMDYKSIGTRKMCRQWKEKNTQTLPDRIVLNSDSHAWHNLYKCPDCNTILVEEDLSGFWNGTCSNFCPECGKALLWKIT